MVRRRSGEKLWSLVPGKVPDKDIIPLVPKEVSHRVGYDAVCLVSVHHWVVLL